MYVFAYFYYAHDISAFIFYEVIFVVELFPFAIIFNKEQKQSIKLSICS